jgi:hypothetical protein
MRHKPFLATLIAATAALTMVAGCGLSTGAGITPSSQEVGFDAAATKTLKQGFKDIHMAIFTKIDTNGDGYIDEYEAGPYFNLQTEFPAATKNSKGHHSSRISKAEFMRYATAGGFLSGRDTPNGFMERMRSFLAKAFDRLDQHHDRLLTPDELSDKALAKLGLGFAYPKIHIQVAIQTFDPGDITAADKTGDGKLSQAEFEDLYIDTVVKLINPNYVPGPNKPTPAPSANPPAPGPNPGPSPASASIDPTTGQSLTPVTPVEWWNF